MSMTYWINLREADEMRRHHEGIATCSECGAQMRKRLDGSWWHSKSTSKYAECLANDTGVS